MECDAGWDLALPATTANSGWPAFTAEIILAGLRREALLDSGSTISMVRADLVPPDLPVIRWTHILCFSNHPHKWPVKAIPTSVAGQATLLEAACVAHLPYPALLGRDLPTFRELIHAAPAPSSTLAEDVATDIGGDPEEEPSGTGTSDPTSNDEEESETTTTQQEGGDPRGGWRADLEFVKAQEDDPSLQAVRDTVAVSEGRVVDARRAGRLPQIEKARGIWERIVKDPRGQGEVRQLVVPEAFRPQVLQFAHEHAWAGHQGPAKTLARILDRFFWPTVHPAVKAFCRSCPICQKMSTRTPPRAPMEPLPIMDQPFQRIAMDFVGPLPRTPRGHRFLLVIMDYATRFPEALPLRSLQAPGVAQALFPFFARVGLPEEILTDQGTSFRANLTKQFCKSLGIRQIFTSVYHPQTDGLVERFNQTFKGALKKVARDHPRQWDRYIDPLLFALRETPQASTGFSPF